MSTTIQESLSMWVVYDHPRDHPEGFPVRRHSVPGGPQELVGVGASLEEARALLPPGLYNLGREPSDDPVIVETWI